MPDLNLKSSYEFTLPPELIARHPREPRDSARLMVVGGMKREDRIFRDIADYIAPGDCIVVNDVRVRKARFYARRATGGIVEVLLTDDVTLPKRRFSCLYRAGHLTPGETLTAVGDPSVKVHLSRSGNSRDALCEAEFEGTEPAIDILDRIGQLPLPPYIAKQRKNNGDAEYEASDAQMYQTVYADGGSAVAAPTAGLHFTPELIAELKSRGARFEHLRLDVGVGTFRPMQSERLDAHHMHSEHYAISPELAEAVASARARGGRVFAVGTTVVRSLEDQYDRFGEVRAGEYDTDIFIKPGRKFGIVDRMITNFHLPGSTLIVLVSAFAGHDAIMAAYADAISKGYMFYSYGDAMLLSPSGDLVNVEKAV